jgi:hypothetical protein
MLGQGPQFNPETMTTEVRNLHGGYAQVMWRQKVNDNFVTPFIKYQYYNGGKKHEIDARSYLVKDLEIGAEWQLKTILNLQLLILFQTELTKTLTFLTIIKLVIC